MCAARVMRHSDTVPPHIAPCLQVSVLLPSNVRSFHDHDILPFVTFLFNISFCMFIFFPVFLLSEEPALVLGREMWLGDPPLCPRQWHVLLSCPQVITRITPSREGEEVVCRKALPSSGKETGAPRSVAANSSARRWISEAG